MQCRSMSLSNPCMQSDLPGWVCSKGIAPCFFCLFQNWYWSIPSKSQHTVSSFERLYTAPAKQVLCHRRFQGTAVTHQGMHCGASSGPIIEWFAANLPHLCAHVNKLILNCPCKSRLSSKSTPDTTPWLKECRKFAGTIQRLTQAVREITSGCCA